MKSFIINSIAFVAVAAAIVSFAPSFGGEGFEISLDSKVVIQKYGPNINDVNSLQLDQSSYNEQLTVKYHHCGRVGKNRVLSLKDGQNRMVKEWKFADAATPVAAMSCNVKDILALKKGNSGLYKLYYISSELPNGRLLTNIVLGNSVKKK